MKNFTKTVLIIFSSLSLMALSGCDDSSAPKSMTEGVPLSEIEAYEQQVKAMEAEAAGEMEINERERESGAQ